jgi:tetratricopeptide (TPR) repeat protein
MNTGPGVPFQERLEQVRSALDSLPPAPTPGERDLLRDSILHLARDVERAIAELEALKESIRPLVARYQELFPRSAAAPAPTGEPTEAPGETPRTSQAPARIDHLGASTYRERGWSALAGGDYVAADRELRRAIQLDPKAPGTLALLAWTRLRLEDSESARPLLDAALDLDPLHGIARMCLGQAYLHVDRLDEAQAILEEVIADAGDRTAILYAHLYLGLVYARRGIVTEADASLRRALELGPNLTEAYWELGRLHHAEGRDDVALAAWRAGGANRFNSWGEQCRVAVQRLEGDGSVT